jgi:hypothetical protein
MILETPTAYYVRIGAIWVIKGNKDQKGDKKPSRTKTFICLFAESE